MLRQNNKVSLVSLVIVQFVVSDCLEHVSQKANVALQVECNILLKILDVKVFPHMLRLHVVYFGRLYAFNLVDQRID